MYDNDTAQINDLIAFYDNPLIIGPYGCRLQKCALSFALGYAPNINIEIGNSLTNFYTYNIWNGMLFAKGREWLPIHTIYKYLKINKPILLVTGINYPELNVFILKPIYEGKVQSLYEITGISHHE